jgi:hypothetical protein
MQFNPLLGKSKWMNDTVVIDQSESMLQAIAEMSGEAETTTNEPIFADESNLSGVEKILQRVSLEESSDQFCSCEQGKHGIATNCYAKNQASMDICCIDGDDEVLAEEVNKILDSGISASKHRPLLTTSVSYRGPLRGSNNSRRKLFVTSESERSLDEDWSNLDSVHSRSVPMNCDQEKWNTLDSVHSKATSTIPVNDYTSNSSGDLNDSSCSFASFGNSDQEATSIQEAELATIRSNFTKLEEQATPRSVLFKQQSLRLKRGASYRGSLSLIKETSNDLE